MVATKLAFEQLFKVFTVRVSPSDCCVASWLTEIIAGRYEEWEITGPPEIGALIRFRLPDSGSDATQLAKDLFDPAKGELRRPQHRIRRIGAK